MFASTVILLLSLGSLAPAGDSFLRSSRGLADIDDQATRENQDGVQGARLREGTLIPTTPGRIVLIGRRWAFIPTSPHAASSDPLASVGAWPERPRTVDSRSNTATLPSSYRSSLDVAANSATDLGSPTAARGKPTVQMLITENLMLQRIVEAIREDAADDRWTVSGEVSEFFDQNRLIIRTAQRAGGN
jgi:hypothetical protein